jgi:hypothetical protein
MGLEARRQTSKTDILQCAQPVSSSTGGSVGSSSRRTTRGGIGIQVEFSGSMSGGWLKGRRGRLFLDHNLGISSASHTTQVSHVGYWNYMKQSLRSGRDSSCVWRGPVFMVCDLCMPLDGGAGGRSQRRVAPGADVAIEWWQRSRSGRDDGS